MESYNGKVCPFCKTEIKDGDAVKVCPSCGVPHHESCWEENNGCTTLGCSEQNHEEQNTNPTDECENSSASKDDFKERICSKCGERLLDDQNFCPKCGTKYVEDIEELSNTTKQLNDGAKNENKKKKLIPIIAGATVVIIGLILFLVIRGTPVSSVTFSKDSLTITEGKTSKLICTVSPDDAKNKTLTWKSSNEDIAKVDESGNITAVSEGACTVTATSNNKKTATCNVTVEAHIPNFNELFRTNYRHEWLEIASDGSYMKVDTNPDDLDEDYILLFYETVLEANEFIEKANTKLGFTAALSAKMGQTAWSLGKQTEENENYKVTYTYHPDKGLEVVYEIKK